MHTLRYRASKLLTSLRVCNVMEGNITVLMIFCGFWSVAVNIRPTDNCSFWNNIYCEHWPFCTRAETFLTPRGCVWHSHNVIRLAISSRFFTIQRKLFVHLSGLTTSHRSASVKPSGSRSMAKSSSSENTGSRSAHFLPSAKYACSTQQHRHQHQNKPTGSTRLLGLCTATHPPTDVISMVNVNKLNSKNLVLYTHKTASRNRKQRQATENRQHTNVRF